MAYVVTYKAPVSGTTPPTVAQARSASILVAEVSAADGDTSTPITHNWQLSSAELAKFYPVVSIRPGTGMASTLSITTLVALTDSVSVTFTKPTTAGSAGTWIVTLIRPHTLIR